MKTTVTKLICTAKARYKIETSLGLFAVIFFVHFIYPLVVCGNWDVETRTKLFTLFAIVGLMGLSVGIKRNELMIQERADFNKDKSSELDRRDVERAYKIMENLGSEHLHIVISSLSELELLLNLKHFPKDMHELFKSGLAAFIVSPIGSVGSKIDPQVNLVNDKRQNKIASRQLAFNTLNKIVDEDDPIKTIYHAASLLKNQPAHLSDIVDSDGNSLNELLDDITLEPHAEEFMRGTNGNQ